MSVTSATNAAAAAATNATNNANAAANAAGVGTGAATGTGTGAATGSTTNATAQNGLNANYQQFLQLLTTQLQNQDPLDPTDTNEMTEEIAQLSEVQGQLNTNQLLTQLISMYSVNQTANAVSYIGSQITATGNQTDLENGQADISYTLPSGASSATVTITNSAGQTVYTGAGTTVSGLNQIAWNGTSNTTDTPTTAPSGVYTFSVTATNSSGTAVTATPLISGVVTSVDSQSGTTSLALGSNITVPLANLQSVTAPSSTSLTPIGSTSTGTNTNSNNG